MTFAKRIFFFLMVNMLVMISISILTAAVNIVLFGEAFPPQNYMTQIIIWSAVWGMGGAFISLFLSKTIVKYQMGVKIINPQLAQGVEKELLHTVYNLAQKAQLPKMPEVGIYESPDLNAFATGASKRNSLVAVSTGLLNTMDKDQVEGVLGHEITHIANGDMVTMTLIQGVVNAFVLFFARIIASIIVNSMSDNNNNRGGGGFIYFGIYMLLQIVFGFLGMIVVGYFSRQREFRADKGGALYAGKEKMISALQALEQNSRRALNLPEQKDNYASLKISHRDRGGIMSLVSTHPPLETRIARLRQAM